MDLGLTFTVKKKCVPLHNPCTVQHIKLDDSLGTGERGRV